VRPRWRRVQFDAGGLELRDRFAALLCPRAFLVRGASRIAFGVVAGQVAEWPHHIRV
jgi:hypothetical protein